MLNDKVETQEPLERVTLWGPQGSFSPEIIPPPQRDTQALNLFQSFLCNEHEAGSLSNVITLWELIPKYTGDYLNSQGESIPNDFKRQFTIYDSTFTLTMFPGTYYPNRKSAKPQRRFPGVREQIVEQALIHLACIQAQAEEVNGEVSYYITFSIREIGSILKAMGRTHSNTQIREALEVLSSSIMTITREGENATSSRNPIIPSFTRAEIKSGDLSGKDNWKIKLHPLVTHAIKTVGYRQFQYDLSKDLAPWAGYLQRQMHYAAPNISSENPLKIKLSELRNRTPGLIHKATVTSIKAVERELTKMQDSGLVETFVIDEIFAKRPGRGRPSPIDAEFTLFPGIDWVRHVKAGHKRLTVTERSLGLGRSQRAVRQMNLPLL